MNTIVTVFLVVFSGFTYLVTFHDGYQILTKSYRHGRLKRLRRLREWIAVRLLPDILREKLLNFTQDDIQIQIDKLNSKNPIDQLGALRHLEWILSFIDSNPGNTQNGNNIERIRRAIYKLLWHKATASEVIQKAVEMLCENDHFRPGRAQE